MKAAVVCAIISLSVATANAETAVVEAYPYQSEAAPAPTTDIPSEPVTVEQRRNELLQAIDRLEHEREELLAAPVMDPTSESAAQVRREANAKLRKINKLKSVLLTLPSQ